MSHTRRPPEADEPIAAICRWAEDGFSRTECGEGSCDVASGYSWNIGTDKDDGARRPVRHDSAHPLSEIAATLTTAVGVTWPWTRAIRCHHEPSDPAWIAAQALDQSLQADTLEVYGAYIANGCGKPQFADASNRIPRKDDEMTLLLHRP
jgi:hypothetical protein